MRLNSHCDYILIQYNMFVLHTAISDVFILASIADSLILISIKWKYVIRFRCLHISTEQLNLMHVKLYALCPFVCLSVCPSVCPPVLCLWFTRNQTAVETSNFAET